MVVCVKMMTKGLKEALTVLIVTHVTVLMSKGSKVVFVACVHNTDRFNVMLKGSKGLKDYPMPCMLKGSKVIATFDPFEMFQHTFALGWKGLSLSFPKLFLD